MPPADRVRGRLCAWAAFVVGLAFALVSLWWALGHTTGLSTVGGSLARAGSAGNPALLAVVWLTVLLKLVAAALGPLAVRAHPRRVVLAGAWAAAGILTAYGGLQTLAGALVQADVLHARADADHRALRWHAYFWDPWFLLWGLLLGARPVAGPVGPGAARVTATLVTAAVVTAALVSAAWTRPATRPSVSAW